MAVKRPGPHDYDTRVNSCNMSPHKQTRMTREKRFREERPSVSPDAPLYDTRNALALIKKVVGGGVITRAPRRIETHLFSAKNAHAYTKGIHL
jgi:hypothetical protein